MLALRVTFLRATFEGGRHDDPGRAEWPPSVMRLFSALVAAAEPGRDDDLLRQMEAADPPEIARSEALTDRRVAFVPLNARSETRHGVLVGRTNGERSWARALPRTASVWYRWPSLEFTTVQRERLATVCRSIAYVGRSTSPAVVDLTDGSPPAHLTVARPRAAGAPALVEPEPVRCPYPGALWALRDAYEAKMTRGETADPWAIGRTVDYGTHERPGAASPVADGPYRTMAVFTLDGPSLSGRHTARITSAVRRAVMSRATRHLPALHGHHDGTVRQCAFLALPFVGSEHADGRVLAVAVALPDLDRDDLRVVAAAIDTTTAPLDVVAGPMGLLRLRRVAPLDAERTATWGLRPGRWARPSRQWSTALPLVLDRHLHRNADVAEEVRRAVRHAGYPDAEHVAVSFQPLLAGALALRPHDTLRRRGDRDLRPYRHATLTFPQPVRGPVVIGSMRHYGLGLCAPVRDGVGRD